ncbi:RDD family protein [Nonomuraea sp. NPDC046570]|uniref:RDD family protein n=1 Tax=Nonomuraea sp. NPDC046570 TaxID=3155255 RepID=UPI0033DC5946
MSEVVTGDAVVVEVRVAQPLIRAVALLIDVVVQLLLMMGTTWLVLWVAFVSDPALIAAMAILANVLVIVGYPVLSETLSRGRSLGKLALGLRVVSDDGGPERFRQALFRGLAGLVEFWMLFGAPALIASLGSQHGKRLGDMFAGTIVISERPPRDRSQPIMMPPALAGWATGLELSQLPAEVTTTARQYLSRWHDLSPQTQYEMGVRISTQVAAYVTPPPPPGVPPHAYLSAVLAERRRRDEARLAHQNPAPTGGNGPWGQPQAAPWSHPRPDAPGYPQADPAVPGYPQGGPYPPPPPSGPPYSQPDEPQITPGGFAPPA